MIVLPTSSQVRYIIKDTTYTCYTNKENRNIALLFIDRDNKIELLNECNNYSKQLEYHFNNLTNEVIKCDSIAKKSINENIVLNNTLEKQKRKNKMYSYFLTGSLILNIVFIIVKL